MTRLREHDLDDDDGRCAECRRRVPAGPCAACEAMICGDCGVLTTDPSGRRVICLSCANLVAGVRARKPRRPAWAAAIALAVLVAFALAALALR